MASASDGVKMKKSIKYSRMKQPPLIKQLKGILSEYPDGGQILKELIQNAEDAGAREVKILHDNRRINHTPNEDVIYERTPEDASERRETTPKYTKFFKGPALCVYNDAVFTDNDWEGIQMIYSSVKEEDPMKVGRFGLGFKSVFHITDFPCVISGDRVLLIDPQQPTDQVNATLDLCALDDYNEEGLDAEAFWCALENTFGLCRNTLGEDGFRGTLFWFPLRENTSCLSETLYSEAKVKYLFESFASEASNILLFLKNIEKISLHVRDTDEEVIEKLRVEIDDKDGLIRQTRSEFKESIRNLNSAAENVDIHSTLHMIIHTSSMEVDKTQEWLIVNYFVRDSASEEFRILIQDKNLGYSPYVGVAMPLNTLSGEFEGHVFCFLPLPREGERLTGLPVHVNGFFALSQNRHHMKWETEEQEGKQIDDKSILWNKALLEEALPKAYELLILEAINIAEKNSNGGAFVTAVYNALPICKFSARNAHNRWMILKNKLYAKLEKQNIAYATHTNEWVALQDASFSTFRAFPGTESDDSMQEAVIRCLHIVGLKYAKFPNSLFDTIQKYFPYVKDLTPGSLLKHLLERQEYRKMSCQDKISVLAYLLLDENNLINIKGLELLPLASEQWTEFNPNRDDVYLCSDAAVNMFPGFEDKLIMESRKLGLPLSENIEKICKSEKYQIQRLNVEHAKKLLKETIISHTGSSTNVRLTKTSSLTSQWLENVWHVLIDKNMVRHFKDIPIVPILTQGSWNDPNIIELARLSDVLILKDSEDSVLVDGLCSCLQAMKVKVLPSLPVWIPFETIKEFVFRSRKEGIVSLLGVIFKKMGDTAVSEFNVVSQVNGQIREALIQFACTLAYVEEDVKTLLRKLRLFRAVQTIDEKGQYTAIIDIPRYIDQDTNFPSGVNLPFSCLRVDRHEENLLQRLQVEKISTESLVQSTIQKLLSSKKHDQTSIFIEYFVQNFKLFESNANICESAAQLPFLTVGKELHKPSDLFDPSCSSLQKLLCGEDLFPENYCRRIDEIHVLRRLGLKGKDKIESAVMLQVANTLNVWSKDKRNSSELSKKAAEFMDVLVNHPNLLDLHCWGTTRLSESIMKLSCIPVMQNPPADYPEGLPWFSKEVQTCKPGDAKGVEWSLLIGTQIPVVECTSDRIVQLFKWNVSPKLDTVLQQLALIRQYYNVKNKPDYMRAVQRIYRYLNENRQNISIIETAIKKRALVWTGSGFEFPEKVIINKKEGDLDLLPYFCNLPEEVRDTEDLFQQLGCPLEQNDDIFLNVLQKIKLKYESSSEISESSVARDSDIVLEILKVLAARKKDGFLDINESEMLMLVQNDSSDKLCLQSVPDCIFDDDQDELDQEEEKIFYIVSENVPVSIAKDLGVKSVKRKTILGATEEFSFEEWGQHESLTTRISTLLRDGYKDGLSVPKEVVQNADDAGATVVKLLYDERPNNDAKRNEKLFSSDLRECQGPALWVYNDSNFTEKDLENITKLNGATKADNQDKIGKFGLGFCSVYNLTDVPSFISGKDMVIFDPHETYLQEARQTRGTGLRVKLSKRLLIRRNQDQFKPYHSVFGCNILDPTFTTFSGTLFRLPLRTEHQAAKSDICKQAYTKDEVSALLSKFVENAGNILLFTQNVKSLQVYHLSKEETDPSQAKLLFNIEKEIEQITRDGTSKHTTSVLKRIPEMLKNNENFNEIHHVELSQTRYKSSFIKSNSEVSSSASLSIDWIVSWALGSNESLRLSKRISDKGAVPLSAVAVPMENKSVSMPLMLNDVPSGFYKTGHLFCFLPLPITTGLPVHVNGCFSVTSDRRGLLCFTEDDTRKGENDMWNQVLMEDSLVQSYMHLLKFLSIHCSGDYSYHLLWPTDGSREVHAFKRRFYTTLIVDKPHLFRGTQDWLSVDQLVFLDPFLRCNHMIGDIAFELLSSVPVRPGKSIIEMPSKVLTSFQEFGCSSTFKAAMVNEEELILHFLCTIDSIFWKHQSDKKNKFILYALQFESQKVSTKLQETKCIPTEPNGVLCRPNELICKTSELADLFDVNDGIFPLQSEGFTESKVIAKLISLGMHDKYLPKDMLLQRCNSIKELVSECGSCAKERCVRFLSYCGKWEVLRDLEKDTDTLNTLKHSILVPVLPTPSDWKFTWRGDNLNEFSSNVKCGKHLSTKDNVFAFERTVHLFRESFFNCLGSVAGFVNEKCFRSKYTIPERLLIAFGVRNEPTVELLTQQLTLLSEQYTCAEKQFSNLDMISKSVYEWLGRLTGDKSVHEISQIPCFLNSEEKTIIVIGNELVSPRKIALKVKAECPPELYCLREFDYKKEKVFKALGVKDHFSVDFLISLLKQFCKKWYQRVCTDIDTVTCLLVNLCESMKMEKITYEDFKGNEANIVAPDVDGFLRPTHELVIEDPAYKSSATLHILHGKISPDTGRTLGVKSKQRKIVEFFSSGFFLPFGQKESLVTRLTGILEDYPCDSSIMKELIQNADDAGASVIYFIKNYDSLSTEKIFGSKGLQGPSLCIFNDSYFTEEDFQGIRNLGVGSKREDPSKTGQYGIGFNAVYHLTDVPSFLTKGPGLGNGGQICIFDPLMAYLDGHVTKENPGIKCDAELMEESFPDMLLGYPNIPWTSGQGTIFRLPLRQTRSDISNNVVSVEQMNTLIEVFKKNMFECLYFLKSIKCIKVLNNRNGELFEEFSVETKLSEYDADLRKEYFSRVKEVVKSNIDARHNNLCMKPIEGSYKISIQENKGRSEQWLIMNRFGVDQINEKSAEVMTAVKEKVIGLLPVAAVALPWPKEDWKSNIERLRKPFTEKNGAKKAYCFLPLPITTGLPVHVSGHFALDKARTKLWNEGIRKSWNEFVIAELLSRAYISAIQYIKNEFVCKHLAEMLDGRIRLQAFMKYHDQFPLLEYAADSNWRSLVTNFYRIIVREDFRIFPSVHAIAENDSVRPTELPLEWVSLSKAETDFNGTFNVISDYIDRVHLFGMEDAKSVEDTVKKMGMKVIETPLNVRNSVEKSGIEYIPISSPELITTFLKTFGNSNGPICQLGKINVPLSETTIADLKALQSMLRYVMKDKLFKQKVQGLPLCLTNDDLLHTFDTTTAMYCSLMCTVLSGSADKFIHSKIQPLIDLPDYYDAGVVKRLSVDDLVSNFADTFNPSIFASGNHVPWNKQTGEPLSPETLQTIFNFIYNESLEPANSYIHERMLNIKLFKYNVQKLNAWSLMPACVICEGQRINELVPVCQTSHLFQRSAGNRSVCQIIEQLRIPALDSLTFKHGPNVSSALHKLLPSTEHPVHLLECLDYYRSRIKACSLTCSNGITLLGFFDDKLNQMKNEMDEHSLRNKLKCLPLYVSYQKDIISIENISEVVILPDSIPSAGIDDWARLTGTVLLKDTDRLSNLYNFLHISRMTELQIYTDKILPNIQNLPRNYWNHHIEYIKDKVLRTSFSQQLNEKQIQLVTQLKLLSFVRVSGTDKKVCDLYDHRNTVFTCMLADDCFLPPAYRGYTWLPFMEKLGLVMEPTSEMIIEFARSLERKVNSPINDTTRKQSKALVECVFSGSWPAATLERIKDIRFVVPHKVDLERKKVFDQPGNGDILICLSGGVSVVHADICWSVMNILPHVPVSPDMLTRLGIHEYPPTEKIIQHCQNVSDVFRVQLEKRIVIPGFVNYQMKMLYEVLLKKYQVTMQQRFQVTPIIFHPEDERMLPVKQVVINLTEDEEVRPYLYKLPNIFGPYEELFYQLGSHKIVMSSDYSMVLEMIKLQFGDGPLPPNQLKYVKTALENIVKLLEKEREPFQNVKELFISNRNNVLVSSKTLTVSNNHDIEDRLDGKVHLNYFLGFREIDILSVRDPVLPFLVWPDHLKPEILTEVVDEQISTENVTQTECLIAQRIESSLRSPQLVEGILRLVKHQKKQNNDVFKSTLENIIIVRLTNIKITKVSGLKTYLKYKGKKVDGTDRLASCFINTLIRKDTKGQEIKEFELYFQINSEEDLLSNLIDERNGLTKLLDVCTDGILAKETVQCLSSILRLVDQPSKIKQKLDQLQIDAYDLPSTWNVSVFPKPGTYVEEKFHPFLEQSISPFKIHEYMYVALEVEDTDDSTDPVYVYAHIVKENPKCQNCSVLSITYSIDVGRSDGLINVPIYRLYRFKPKQPEDINALVAHDIEPVGSIPIDENFRRVRQMLAEAWTLDETERKKVIRRLLTRWHPDRNGDHPEYAQRLFNYVNEIVIKLEHKEYIENVTTNETGRMPPDMSRSRFGSSSTAVYNRGCRLAAGFHNNMQDYNRSTRTGPFAHYRAEEAVVKHIGEAKRWHRQAVQDFKAAESSIICGAQDQSFNWVCYKCHQASEKALKAAWFSKNANRANIRQHSLTALASGLDDGAFYAEASSLESITGDYSSMRYPDAVLGRHQIPSEMFDETKANQAIEVTKRILELAAEFID